MSEHFPDGEEFKEDQGDFGPWGKEASYEGEAVYVMEETTLRGEPAYRLDSDKIVPKNQVQFKEEETAHPSAEIEPSPAETVEDIGDLAVESEVAEPPEPNDELEENNNSDNNEDNKSSQKDQKRGLSPEEAKPSVEPIGILHAHQGDFPILKVLGEEVGPNGEKYTKIIIFSVTAENGQVVSTEETETYAPSDQIELFPAKKDLDVAGSDNPEQSAESHQFKAGDTVWHTYKGKKSRWIINEIKNYLSGDIKAHITNEDDPSQQTWFPVDKLAEEQEALAPEDLNATLESLKPYFAGGEKADQVKIKLGDQVVNGRCQGYSTKFNGVYIADASGERILDPDTKEPVIAPVSEFLSWQELRLTDEIEAEKAEQEAQRRAEEEAAKAEAEAARAAAENERIEKIAKRVEPYVGNKIKALDADGNRLEGYKCIEYIKDENLVIIANEAGEEFSMSPEDFFAWQEETPRERSARIRTERMEREVPTDQRKFELGQKVKLKTMGKIEADWIVYEFSRDVNGGILVTVGKGKEKRKLLQDLLERMQTPEYEQEHKRRVLERNRQRAAREKLAELNSNPKNEQLDTAWDEWSGKIMREWEAQKIPLRILTFGIGVTAVSISLVPVFLPATIAAIKVHNWKTLQKMKKGLQDTTMGREPETKTKKFAKIRAKARKHLYDE